MKDRDLLAIMAAIIYAGESEYNKGNHGNLAGKAVIDAGRILSKVDTKLNIQPPSADSEG